MTVAQQRAACNAASFTDPRVWPDRKENSDSYSGEIARHGRHRAIQRDRRPKLVTTRWEPLYHRTTKNALLRLWATSEPLYGGNPALGALPDHTHHMGRVTP